MWVTRAPKTRLQCWVWCEHNLWHVRSYYTRFLAYIDEWNSTGEMCERRASLSYLVVFICRFPFHFRLIASRLWLVRGWAIKMKITFHFYESLFLLLLLHVVATLFLRHRRRWWFLDFVSFAGHDWRLVVVQLRTCETLFFASSIESNDDVVDGCCVDM